MRIHFVYGLLFALLTACTSSQYRIDGIFTAEDGTPVWLIDQNAKDTLAETAVRDGAFTFSGRIREPFFAYVGNGKQRVHLILEPGTATVDIDERTVSGTPMEDAYGAFHRRFYGYKREQRAEKTALADSVVRRTATTSSGRWRWKISRTWTRTVSFRFMSCCPLICRNSIW